jgi:hypothetical protein
VTPSSALTAIKWIDKLHDRTHQIDIRDWAWSHRMAQLNHLKIAAEFDLRIYGDEKDIWAVNCIAIFKCDRRPAGQGYYD